MTKDKKHKLRKFKEYYGDWDEKIDGVRVRKEGKHNVKKV